MLKSRGVGGPLDGVQIEAGQYWDGQVHGGGGRYEWREGAWRWKAHKTPVPKTRRPRKDTLS